MNSALIESLLVEQAYPHPCKNIELIETHISWIILTGDYAYKIKKPVNFGFLDFTSLAQRKQYCEAELNLNSRSAPDIYINVVPIGGSNKQPNLECTDDDTVFEYAIKMNQFAHGACLNELCNVHALNFSHIDELAEKVADFHKLSDHAPSDSPYGTPDQLFIPVEQNFIQIKERLTEKVHLDQLEHLQAWTYSSFDMLRPTLESRRQNGKVRECHGDLHLGNIALYKDQVTLFDCIEFNDAFRWIDLISDAAFLVMDLEQRGESRFANRFLNHYLEQTGDYEGLRLLPFYKAYRAIVRAKITLFEMEEAKGQPDELAKLWEKYQSYIDLAERCSSLPNRFVLLMHGVSGTGKSTVALRLVDQLGAIRIRSDVERKRLYKLKANHHPDAETSKKLYSKVATHLTYETLGVLCGKILDGGLCVIIDATNLMSWQRAVFQHEAAERAVPLIIADCQASMSVIEEWIHKRENTEIDASDANLSIVDQQVQIRDSLNVDELNTTFVIHSNIIDDTKELVSEIQKLFK